MKREGGRWIPQSRFTISGTLFCAAILLWTTTELSVAKQNGNRATERPTRERPANRSGQRAFESTCSACHGLDGRGGEQGAGIARNPDVQALSDRALAEVIRNGVPAKGMPSFGFIGDREIERIVAYLRILGGSHRAALRGDPSHGEKLFFGKAGCSECHRAQGRGGFIGSDLSQFARTHDAAEIRRVILAPNQILGSRGKLVHVETRDGSQFSGLVRNEDNFSLQLLSTDGVFRSVAKQDILRLTRETNSLMPSDLAERMTAKDIEDVISYLVAVASSRRVRPASSGNTTTACDGEGSRVSETGSGSTTQYLVDTLNPTGLPQVVDERVNGTVGRTYAHGLQQISENQQIGSTWTPGVRVPPGPPILSSACS